MTTKNESYPPRALSSEDGKTWSQSDPERGTGWPAAADESVVKLVVGRLGNAEKGDKWTEVVEALESGIIHRFPNLTHLHVWGLPLEHLGELPEGLKVLDVRKCPALSRLPDIPSSLETLDLAGSSSLTNFPKQGLPSLRYLHVDNCLGFEANRLCCFLEDCKSLEEFTAEGCSQIKNLSLPKQSPNPPDGNWHPGFPPRRFKKLVLKGCSALKELPDLSAYPWLHHLNLNDCVAFEELQALPVRWTSDGDQDLGIRYLLTAGCHGLKSFAGMDIRKVHRSRKEDENVAAGFRTMQRLWDTQAELTRAKLLLLGSGRCGKTTVAKALQWKGFAEEARKASPDLNPSQPQFSTHGIQFWPWDTAFEPSGGTVVAGHAHIWDFAGQEIYQNTHRLFASEGTVFLVVTTSAEIHRQRIELEAADKNEDQKAVFIRENEYRELKYWLDYIRTTHGVDTPEEMASGPGRVSIRIVFTQCHDEKMAKTLLMEQAGPYADLIQQGQLPVTVTNFHEVGWENDLEGLSFWLKKSLGEAADGYGRQVPGVYAKMAAFCEKQLRETSGSDILEFGEWEKNVCKFAPDLPLGSAGKRVSREQAMATARYLHHCGLIFWLKDKVGNGDVLINQRWGVDLIYALLVPQLAEKFHPYSGQLIDSVQFISLLGECRFFSMLTAHQQRTFLDFLDTCNICVRIADRWMAVQRELLHDKKPMVERGLELLWNRGRSSPGEIVNHCFAIHGSGGSLLGNSDYRDTLSFLVRGAHGNLGERLFGKSKDQTELAEQGDTERTVHNDRTRYSVDCRFWNDGFMLAIRRESGRPNFVEDVQDDTQDPEIVMQVDWRPMKEPASRKPGFAGGLFIQLLAPKNEGFGDRLREVLFGKGGPLKIFKDRHIESDLLPQDLSQVAFGSRRGLGLLDWQHQDGPDRPDLRYDIAISYRSAQLALVSQLIPVLRRAGFTHCFEYSGDDERSLQGGPGGSKITSIYDYLKFAKVLIVVCSKEYFEEPNLEKRKNLYCPVELAEAVTAYHEYSPDEKKRFSMRESKRGPGQFFWLSDGLSANDINDSARNILDGYFTNISQKQAPLAMRTPSLTAIDKREYRSMEACGSQQVATFLDEVGRDGKQLIRVDDKGEWIRALVERIHPFILPKDTTGL